jgi:hypothetical protein
VLHDILGKVVKGRSFVGWTYDRFLIFTILSGNDYFKNLPNHALTTVHKAMAKAALPTELLAPLPHPELHTRPAAWYTREALLLYAAPVIDAVAHKECWTGGYDYETRPREGTREAFILPRDPPSRGRAGRVAMARACPASRAPLHR